ncbi:STAS domain-containing protein [Sphingomonas tabacisoli]|uniref:Anti-sigma factor antagonist n=1 Tax=Sphingomonas tabacisoli TaxID=2249466 RepID=A0ABW4I3B5_9SPHN
MWTSETRGGALVGRASGRIDELHWEAFAEALKTAVETARAGGLGRLVVDLSQVDYMSSRGLRALTLGKREADGAGVPVVLAAPNELVREILAISRYDKIFAVADTVDGALES